MTWKFANPDGTVVNRDANGGMTQSCLTIAQEVQDYLASGGVIAPYVAPPAPPVTEVTMAQARKQLIIEGVMPSEIDALLSQMPHPQGDLAKVDWEFQPNVHRDNALVAYVAQQKGWDSAHVDALFAAAAALT
jgi:hypothetical protein